MYAKIFGSILDSSVWEEAASTRIVWITMLVMADENGFVKGVEAGLANRARVSRVDCRQALEILTAPDIESQDQDFGGRRIEKVEGGWLVLNYRKYRELRTREQQKKAERQKRWRHNRKAAEGEESSTERLHGLHVDGVDGIASASAVVVGSGSKAVELQNEESSQNDTLEGDAGRFVDPTHRAAYLGYRRTHKYPDAFDAIVRSAHQPISGGVAYSWEHLGAALLAMRGVQADFSQNALRGFARRAAEAPPTAAPVPAGEQSTTVQAVVEESRRRRALQEAREAQDPSRTPQTPSNVAQAPRQPQERTSGS